MSQYSDKILKAKAAIQSRSLNGLVPRGTWSEKNIYMPQDIVYYKGKTYICITANQGTDPKKSKDFVPFAGNGKDGIDAKNIEVGRNNTHIRWRYVDSVKWYNIIEVDKLVGAQGEKGDKGEQGVKGAVGKAGENGKQVQLRKTKDAIEWRYEGGTWIVLVRLNELKGPKGDKGDDGKSAYEIWLEVGNTGSKRDFLTSLQSRQPVILGRGGGGGGTPGATALSQLSDVTITNPATGEVLKYDGSKWVNGTSAGGGDMLAAVYDPQNISADAFDVDNHTNGTTNKVFTAVEKTKLAGIEAGADVTDAANVDAAGATMNTDTSLAGNGYFLDEDDMASNSATKVPSQQSVKAYVDDNVGGGQVDSVVAGNNIDVDATDPANPIVSVETLTLADISDITASATEVNYTDGVTSSIQTQLDAKSTASKVETLTNKTIDANGTGNSISNLETADFAANVVDTDGTLAANSDSRLATQKATKTYADTKSTASKVETLTNKTIDANGTGNSISNLEVADLASGVLDIDLSSVSASDDTIPSAKATKTMGDLKLAKASNLSDVANAATSFGNIKQAATDSATGVVELATGAEVDTGTDTTRVVTPDTLASSYAGTKVTSLYVIEAATTVTTGDGKAYFRIPPALNGMDLVTVGASVLAKSTSGTPTIQIARGRQAAAGTAHAFTDMLSTKITIDANEFDSKDAATPAVIDTGNDDILTGDLIRIDVDVAGTAATGLFVTMQWRLP